MRPRHREAHRTGRIGWLRASVLGANDGIVSTASLVLGAAAADAKHVECACRGHGGSGRRRDVHGRRGVRVGQLASPIPSALTCRREEQGAGLRTRTRSLRSWRRSTSARGLDPDLAQPGGRPADGSRCAGRAMLATSWALGPAACATQCRPLWASAASFAVGAAAPLAIVALSPNTALLPAVGIASLGLLGVLGWLAAPVGGARPWAGAARVVFWGALAMAVTAAVGALFGAIV